MLKQLLHGDAGASNQPLISRVQENPYRYTIILLCLINFILALVSVGIFLIAAIQKLFVMADFTSFYTGYYMVRTGLGAELYDPMLQSSLQQRFMGGITFEGGVLLFPNPPHVAILFSPLSLVQMEAAFYVWTILQLAMLVWILLKLNHLFSHWKLEERIALFIAILAFWPLVNTFLLGQFSLFLLLGLLEAYTSMRNSKFYQAGLWFFLLSIKPHSLLIPGIALLNRRYWRVALVTFLVSVFAFIVSIVIIGTKPWLGYIESIKSIGSYFGQYGVTPASEYTLRGLLASLFGNSNPSLVNLLSLIILVVAMIVVWLLWYRNNQQSSLSFTFYFAITVLLSVFLSLHLNPHDSLILVLPVALFYDYLRQRQYPRKAYTIFLLIWPVVFIISAFSRVDLFGIVRLPILLIITLLAWMGYYMLRELRMSPQDELSASS